MIIIQIYDSNHSKYKNIIIIQYVNAHVYLNRWLVSKVRLSSINKYINNFYCAKLKIYVAPMHPQN